MSDEPKSQDEAWHIEHDPKAAAQQAKRETWVKALAILEAQPHEFTSVGTMCRVQYIHAINEAMKEDLGE